MRWARCAGLRVVVRGFGVPHLSRAKCGAPGVWWGNGELAAAEGVDLAAVLLGGAVRGGAAEGEEFLALGFGLLAFALAFGGFGVESLGDGGGAAHVAEDEDLDGEFGGLVADIEGVAEAELAGGFRFEAVAFDAAEVAGLDGEGAGFEEACGPEPLVDAHKRIVLCSDLSQPSAAECRNSVVPETARPGVLRILSV